MKEKRKEKKDKIGDVKVHGNEKEKTVLIIENPKCYCSEKKLKDTIMEEVRVVILVGRSGQIRHLCAKMLIELN